MRVLVTGVSGFLGRALAALAHQRGHEVAGVDVAPLNEASRAHVSHFAQCALEKSAIDAFIGELRPELCFHCAGRASVPQSVVDPAGDFEAAAVPTVRLLDALRRLAPECKTLLASSAAVYGSPEVLPISESLDPRPVSPYGFHKLASEQLCREFSQLYGLQTACVRIFSAFGEGLQRQVVWDLLEKAGSSTSIRLQGVGHASRDFIHVHDVVAGMMLVAQRGRMDGECYNLASGVETSIEQLSSSVCALLGGNHVVEFDGNVPRGTPLRWRADMRKTEALGFVPAVSLEMGLAAVVDWWSRRRNAQP